mmetsp:Transcript_21272/g.47761  ORF Transcript_21272/g.47761 Transcript_21272/m.47761 type:complete len:120 (+) Transcript_21272:187-546(+)
MDTLHRTLYRHYICIEDQGLRSTQLVPTSSWRKRFAMARLSFFDTTTMDISSVGTRPGMCRIVSALCATMSSRTAVPMDTHATPSLTTTTGSDNEFIKPSDQGGGACGGVSGGGCGNGG